jgi:hypothetical protein
MYTLATSSNVNSFDIADGQITASQLNGVVLPATIHVLVSLALVITENEKTISFLCNYI